MAISAKRGAKLAAPHRAMRTYQTIQKKLLKRFLHACRPTPLMKVRNVASGYLLSTH